MHKTCDVQIKATGTEDGLGEGQFRALVSVFNNVDSYGDVIVPGAFTDTLADWEASGDPIPVYWSHQMQDPEMNIGYVLEAAETDLGLEVLAQLDTGDDASPKARQAYRLLKGRRVKQFSFAYDVEDGGPVTKDGDTHYELRRLKLHEVGPTPVGANPATELLAVKQAAERVTTEALSATDADTVREALASLEATAAQLKNVLASGDHAEDEATTQEDASEGGPAKDEEPPTGAKSKEPTRHPSAATWATRIRMTELEGVTL